MIQSRSADYLRSRSDLLTNPFQFIPNTSKVFFFWLQSYLSWWAIALLIITAWLAFSQKNRKIALLFIWVLLPFFSQAAIGKIVYPRYLLPLVPFLLISLAWGISRFKIISAVIAVLMLINWVRFDWRLITNPAQAPLHLSEKNQYLYQWSAGYGIKPIADYLKNQSGNQPVMVATEGYFGTLPNGLQIYLDGAKGIEVIGVGQPIGSFSPLIDAALSQGKQVYLVVNNTRLKLQDWSRLELLAEYPKPVGPQGQEKLLFFKVLAKNEKT
jgi:hypothetical protein